MQHDLTDLARSGSIVFVMRSAGVLNFLFLAWLMRQMSLPPLRAALGLTGFMPWLARVRPTRGALEDALERGESSVVFLGRASGPDPFPLLVAAQRRLARPILLVPALLVWTRRPQKLKPTLGEILFGTPDAPSRFANAIGFVLNHRRAVLRLGRPSDLGGFVAERAAEPDSVLGRKTRGALHLHLAREVRAVVGPPLKTASRMRGQVLRDKGLRRALELEARETGRHLPELEGEAERDLREIASRYSPAFIELVRPLLAWLFRRLYDAVDVDEEGLARVKRAAGDAPIVLCPSHKSYIDFLVLSWIFYEYGMTPPHIAAGINLSFWPFGAIARHGGAFFIRRTLKGDRVYTATLRAYVKQLLRDRFPQEFYLEGGRSRSGKLLFPKTGLFSMEVDAWLEQAAEDVLFVPVAIDYERLMEGRSYARELAGGAKPKEDLRGLLRARKVLGRRYGRLTVQFEEPISLRAFAAQRLGDRARSLTLDEVMPPLDAPVGSGVAGDGRERGRTSKRELVQALANRVAYGINRAITMTPVGLVAASLLAHVRRGLPAEEVARRVELLRYIAGDAGARFSRGLAGAPSDPRLPGPVADAVTRLTEEGLVRVERAAGETIYQVVEERRTLLDYHKNAVIHRYVSVALIATALRASRLDAPADDVKAGTRWLSRLLKLEFMYRVEASFDEIFEENAAFLRRLGIIEESAGRLCAGAERATLDFLAGLLRPYLEAYGVVAEALLELDRASPGAHVDRQGLVKAAMERGRAAYASGRVTSRESLSKATFENAAEWLAQQRALEPQGGHTRLAAGWREGRLPETVRKIRDCLGP
ncbi:MAG: glycerol-3-phosphate acyltransferase [Anaeromyxobacter sp. RBG_16_69_14]|nr:MAG: glycerol-3-phosphate acyltransferase [Anaeromyxobacter sp. RBG_16_69_14]